MNILATKFFATLFLLEQQSLTVGALQIKPVETHRSEPDKLPSDPLELPEKLNLRADTQAEYRAIFDQDAWNKHQQRQLLLRPLAYRFSILFSF